MLTRGCGIASDVAAKAPVRVGTSFAQELYYGSCRRRSTGMLAGSAAEFMERHLRNAAQVDANRWESPAASDPGREPLVEYPVVRNGSRFDDLSYPLWGKSIRGVV